MNTNQVKVAWNAYATEKRADKAVSTLVTKADARLVVQRFVQELNILDRNAASFTAIKRRATPSMNARVTASMKRDIDMTLKLFDRYVADVRATYAKWKKLTQAPEKTRRVSIFPVGFKTGPRFVTAVNLYFDKLHALVETNPANTRTVPIIRTKNNSINTRGKSLINASRIKSTKNKLVESRKRVNSLGRELNRAKYELAIAVDNKTRATKKWKMAQQTIDRAIKDTRRVRNDQRVMEKMMVAEIERLQRQVENATRASRPTFSKRIANSNSNRSNSEYFNIE
jgi:hypothetical protein